MRLLFPLVLLLLSVGVLAQQATRSIKWERMIGWKHSEVEAYYDVKSLKREATDNKEYAYGIILFHRKYPVEVDIQGTKTTVTSFARYFVIDCDKAIIAPIADYYFNLNRLPTITDKLVSAIDYSGNAPDATEIQKSNPIYKTLCPVYI